MAFLEPVLIAPLYNHFVALPADAPVRAPMLALARKAGVGDAPIMISDESRRTSTAIADIAGFGPTKRIVLSDALLENATTGEVLFLTARELGHYAHTDDFRLSLFWTFLFITCTALAVVISDRVGFRRDDDPLARLALVLGFLGLLGLIATPIYNGYSRNIESRADAYALALTHDRVSAVRAYVRIADETLAPLCPSRVTRIYFFNSPPLGTRIAKAAGHRDPCQ
jgi:STE24 endopeptidase